MNEKDQPMVTHESEVTDTQDHDLEKQDLFEGLSAVDSETPRWYLNNDSNSLFKFSQKDVINFLCALLNTASTVCIVFANKIIFTDPQFRKFQVGTAVWHFAMTAILLCIATLKPFSLFTPVRLALRDVMPISVLFVGFLVLGNLSLALNPVSFYQLTKIMTTPTVVAVNFLMFRKHISYPLLSAILASCLGVALPNVSMVTSNPMGTIAAVAAFVITAFYQIWIGKKVEDLNVCAPTLLLNQAPIAVVLLLVLLPFTDTVPDFRTVEPKILATFIFSGLVAAGLNLSQFLIIGRTSAITFNVVSNTKSVVIIILGWYSADQLPVLIDVVGVALALGGASAYSWLQRK